MQFLYFISGLLMEKAIKKFPTVSAHVIPPGITVITQNDYNDVRKEIITRYTE